MLVYSATASADQKGVPRGHRPVLAPNGVRWWASSRTVQGASRARARAVPCARLCPHQWRPLACGTLHSSVPPLVLLDASSFVVEPTSSIAFRRYRVSARRPHFFSCSHLPAEPQPWACSRKRRRRRRPRGRLGLRHQAWKVRDCCEVDWHRMVVGAMYFEGVWSRAAYRRVATNILPVLLPFVCYFPFGQMRSAPFCSSAQIPSLT